jgi:hypothetical protein
MHRSVIAAFLLILPLSSQADTSFPQVYRTFMPEAGPSAFAVQLTEELALCYDPLRGGINQAWQGRIQLAPTLQAKINQPAEIDGRVFYQESTVQPLRFDPDQAPERRFKGYRYVDGAVIFESTLDGVAIRETLRATKGRIERHWSAQTTQPLFLRLDPQTQAEVTCIGGVEVSPGLWKFTAPPREPLSFAVYFHAKTDRK